MLYNEHSKAGKELQRKIAKLREENKDPSLPQKVPSRMAAAAGSAISTPLIPPQPQRSPPLHLTQNQLSESQQTVDESFMLLGQKSEPGDAFNHFWKITEGMLEHLSQPVAFATAPLAPPSNSPSGSRRRDGNASSDTDVEDPITKTLNRGLDFVKAARSKMLIRNDSGTYTSDSDSGRPGLSTFPPKPQPIGDDWDEDVGFDDDDMADSFCLVPSKADAPVSLLKKENAVLKDQLEKERLKLAVAERMLKQRQEQDQHLRDSIMLARKEAQRAMTSSMALRPQQLPPPIIPAPPPPVDIAALNINVPPVLPPLVPTNAGLTRDREAQLVRRVRELEEDVRTMRIENDKQKAMIAKFRERWEKLKESAKKKKEAKVAAEATNVVNDRIDEDPEAEAEAERDDLRPRKHTELPSPPEPY
ncbi:hypothetical protein PHLCEN_2v746 [Hermanssonia centrifuga]|uniref:Uncharacterized protein n=1 Tax=Hermanssonia centrifuga TaxID=98765 RepID=A0A2R6S541_9APHY|nr:hypothetical protein PHLCEN_2v746 [Hermanssonia centrifuga]